MRRKLFLLAVAAAALASCSSDETLSVNQGLEDANSISFRPAIQGMTRAANGTGLKTAWETGDVLHVTAQRGTAKYFQDDFIKDGTGFNSAAKHFWPSDLSTNNLTFTVFWGAPQKTWAADGDGKSLAAAYTVPDAVASQQDLLFAMETVSSKPTDGGVKLNFRHMLSQICVKVANDQAHLQATITGVRVGYLNKIGTFTYTGGVTATQEDGSKNATLIDKGNWTKTDDGSKAATYLYQQDVSSTVLNGVQSAQSFAGNFSPWILMPQQLSAASGYTDNETNGAVNDSQKKLNGAYIALKMALADATNPSVPIVTEQWCYWPIGTEWKPGYKYTYTINAGSGGYQPTDQNNDKTDLDPVLGGTVIWFQPTCTIDEWVPENYGISAPIARTASYSWSGDFTTGTNENISLDPGANGTYDITITGLTEGHKVTASANGNFTAAPTVSNSGTVPDNGTLTITGTLSANTTAAASSVITIVDDNGTAGNTADDVSKTITITQAAPTTW